MAATDLSVADSVAGDGSHSSGQVTLCYVVPAHNEEGHLDDCVRAIARRLADHPGSEILIVENGSEDDTATEAERLALESDGSVTVRALSSAPGLAAAYRVGASVATADVIVFTAVDLPFGFTDLDRLLAFPAEQRPDFAIGSKAHRDSVSSRSFMRWFMSLGMLIARRLLLGAPWGDTQGSLLIRRELANELVPKTVGDGYVFGAELAVLASHVGRPPVEIPVVLQPERRESRIRPIHDSIEVLAGLVKVRRHMDRLADDRAARELDAATSPGRVLRWAVGRDRPGALLAGTFVLAVASVAACAAMLAVLREVIVRFADDGSASSAPTVRSMAVGLVGTVGLLAWVLAHLAGRSRRARWVAEAVPLRSAVWRRRDMFLASGVAALGSVLLGMWRVLPHFASVGQGVADARWWYWIGWRAAEQIRDGDVIVGGIPTVLWPVGLNLWPSDGHLPAMVGTFWNLVVGDPTVAFNLATATALVTTAVASVRLARTVGSDPRLAAIVGLAIGTAPALTVRLEVHFNLLFAFPAVLIVDLALRHILRRDQPFPISRAAVLLVLCYLSSGYYLLFGVVVLTLTVLFSGRGLRWVVSSFLRMSAAGLVSLVVLAPFLVPKLELERTEAELGAPRLSEFWFHGADSTAIATPPNGAIAAAFLDDESFDVPSDVEATAFVGFFGLVGIAALCWYRSALTRPIVAAAAVLYIVGLGDTLDVWGVQVPPGVSWLPAGLLAELPGLSGLRAPNRTSFVLVPVCAAAAAVVASWFRRRPGAGSVACLVSSLALVCVSVRVPTYSTADLDGELVTTLSAVGMLDDPGAVLHLPDDCLVSIYRIEMQMYHGQPEVGCQGMSASIGWRSALGSYAYSSAWAALRCAPGNVGLLPAPEVQGEVPSVEAVGRLRSEIDVGVVIFDRVNRCPERGKEILDALLEGGSSVGDDGRFVVIEVP